MKKIEKILDGWEVKTQSMRAKFLAPFLNLLTQIGVTSNWISNSKIFIVIVAFIVARNNVRTSFWIFLLCFLVDLFDGSLARYQNKSSDRGKFVDVLTDQTVYAGVILTLIMLQVAEPLRLIYNLLAVYLLYLLSIIVNNEGEPTDWIIKPVARKTFYKDIFFVAGGLFVFGWLDKAIVGQVCLILNIILTIHITYLYITFLKRGREGK